MAAPTLPVLSESVLKRRPRLSGVCPAQAWLRMLGVGLAASIVVGVIAHYLGLAIRWVGGLIDAVPYWLSEAGGCGICCVVVPALVAFGAVVLAYPFAVGAANGTIIGSLGRGGECRSTRAAAWAGAIQGMLAYAAHVAIAVLVDGGLHVLAVDAATIGVLFDTTLTGTPWWMIVWTAVEAIIVIGLSAYAASDAIARSAFCEEHGVWFGPWREARYPVRLAEPIAHMLENGAPQDLEGFTPVRSTDFPHLLVSTRRCPVDPSCDVQMAGQLVWQEKKVEKEGKESVQRHTRDWFDTMVPASLADALDEALELKETGTPGEISAKRAARDAQAASPKLVRLCIFREGSAPDEDTALQILHRFHPEIPREEARSLIYVQGVSHMPPSPHIYAVGMLSRLRDEADWPDYSDTSRYEWWIDDEGTYPRTGTRMMVLRIYELGPGSRPQRKGRPAQQAAGRAVRCACCGVPLLTEGEAKTRHSPGPTGVWMGSMEDLTQVERDRNAIGVTCAICGRSYCVACMQKHGRPHPGSGGLACLECGGHMKTFERG